MKTSKQRLHDLSIPLTRHNSTPTSNALIDLCLKEHLRTELIIAMIINRHTVGKGQTWVTFSISDLEQHTALSRSVVIKSIRKAEDAGILKREPDGNSYKYKLHEQYTRGAV